MIQKIKTEKNRICSLFLVMAMCLALTQNLFVFNVTAQEDIKNQTQEDTNNFSQEDLTQYVDPFFATEVDFGQLFPGAVVPSGLVKLSPDSALSNGNKPNKLQSGYDYKERRIIGFSHTRIEGVGGIGSGGDILVSPSYMNFERKPANVSRTLDYINEEEFARPGYYSVLLTPKTGTGNGTNNTTMGKIKAEMTADTHVGYHRYTFPQAGNVALSFDMSYGYDHRNGGVRNNTTLNIGKTNDGRTTLSGTFSGNNVSGNGRYTLFYYAETMKPAASVQTWASSSANLTNNSYVYGADIGAVMRFDVQDNEEIELKVALSVVSPQQAKIDMYNQSDNVSFDEMRANAKNKWNEILSTVDIELAQRDENEMKFDENDKDAQGNLKTTGILTEEQEDERLKRLFYTSLYRMFTTPVNASTTSGTYRALDGVVYHNNNYTHYDSWSLWDDFRKYPLIGLFQPELYKDFIRSVANMMAYRGNNFGWSTNNQTVPNVRIEHAIALLADGYAKGFTDIENIEKAYEFAKAISDRNWDGNANIERGYFPLRVDRTVENSYDDWALSIVANALGKTEDATAYKNRGFNFYNIARTNAIQKPRDDGSGIVDNINLLWSKTADGQWSDGTRDANVPQAEYYGNNSPYHDNYQGTIWQYSMWNSYDVSGLQNILGGQDDFLIALKHLYGMYFHENNRNNTAVRVRKTLHNNANEIDLQTPYYFNFAGKPDLTQYWVRQIYTKKTYNRYSGDNDFHNFRENPTMVYDLKPAGLLETMDDDCGTMTGNFVAAAMGLYPMTPGDTTFQIGSPFFKKLSLDVGNGKTLTINAPLASSRNFYIQSATLNGKPLNRSWIDYSEIIRGGELSFVMGDQPSDWASDGDLVPSASQELTVKGLLDYPEIVYSKQRIFEDKETDDGSINEKVDINLENTEEIIFTGNIGDDFVQDEKVKIYNLPTGLSAKIIKTDSHKLELSFEGKAVNHKYSVDDLSIVFEDSAFDGGFAFDITNSSNGGMNALIINFYENQKVKLTEYIQTLKTIPSADYTQASFAALSAKIAEAETLLNVTHTDVQLDAMFTALYNLEIKLETKPNSFERFDVINAELSQGTGTSVSGNFVTFTNDSYAVFNAIDFGTQGAAAFDLLYDYSRNHCLEDAVLEVRKGSVTGDLVTKVDLTLDKINFAANSTGYELKTVYLRPGDLTGIQNLYFVFKGTVSGTLQNTARMASVTFKEAANSVTKIEAETYDLVTTTTNPLAPGDNVIKAEAANVGGTFDGGWFGFSNVDFTQGLTQITVNAAHNAGRCGDNPRLEFRIGSIENEILATIPLQTGTGWNDYKLNTININTTVTGYQNLYITLRADNGTSDPGGRPFVANIDYIELMGNIDKTELAAAITTADAKIKEQYTNESWTAFETILTAAKTANTTANTSQDWVNYHNYELNEAIKSLKHTAAFSDATLKSLTIQNGNIALVLSPIFDSQTESYEITTALSRSITQVTINAEATQQTAVITADDIGAKTLQDGENTFSVNVTAQDGTTVKTYTIKLTRNAQYIVRFNLNGGTGNPPSNRNVSPNATMTAPTTPQRSGYRFLGWFTTPSTGGTQWNFTTSRVNADMTLYARWTRQTHTVTFRGGKNFTKTITHGNKINLTAAERRRSGFTYIGVFTDSKMTRKFNNANITSARTLYIKWERNPTKPTNVRSAKFGTKKAKITWKKQAGVIFEIQMRRNNGKWTSAGKSKTGARTFTTRNLQKGRYSFRIRATKKNTSPRNSKYTNAKKQITINR